MTASVYLAAMGPEGLRRAALMCYQNAHTLAEKLCCIPGIHLKYTGTFFHEFVTEQADSDRILSALEKEGIPMASAEVTMLPQTYVTLTEDADLTNIQRILDFLDEDDDVQEVYHNWEE